LSLPSGSYDADIFDNRFLPDNFNPGKGAVGYGAQSAIVMSNGQYGIALSARHQRYGKSTANYRFGSETELGAQFFGQLNFDPHWKIIPYTDISREQIGPNKTVDDQDVHATGGNAWMAGAGINFRYDDMTLGLRASLPIHQSFASNEAEAGTRWSIQLLHNF
jgi:hypothetical protein